MLSYLLSSQMLNLGLWFPTSTPRTIPAGFKRKILKRSLHPKPKLTVLTFQLLKIRKHCTIQNDAKKLPRTLSIDNITILYFWVFWSHFILCSLVDWKNTKLKKLVGIVHISSLLFLNLLLGSRNSFWGQLVKRKVCIRVHLLRMNPR